MVTDALSVSRNNIGSSQQEILDGLAEINELLISLGRSDPERITEDEAIMGWLFDQNL